MYNHVITITIKKLNISILPKSPLSPFAVSPSPPTWSLAISMALFSLHSLCLFFLHIASCFWYLFKVLPVSVVCFFLLLSDIPLYRRYDGYHNLFIHSLVDGNSRYFQFLAITYKAAVNIHIQVSFFFVSVFFKYILLIMLLQL